MVFIVNKQQQQQQTLVVQATCHVVVAVRSGIRNMSNCCFDSRHFGFSSVLMFLSLNIEGLLSIGIQHQYDRILQDDLFAFLLCCTYMKNTLLWALFSLRCEIIVGTFSGGSLPRPPSLYAAFGADRKSFEGGRCGTRSRAGDGGFLERHGRREYPAQFMPGSCDCGGGKLLNYPVAPAMVSCRRIPTTEECSSW